MYNKEGWDLDQFWRRVNFLLAEEGEQEALWGEIQPYFNRAHSVETTVETISKNRKNN